MAEERPAPADAGAESNARERMVNAVSSLRVLLRVTRSPSSLSPRPPADAPASDNAAAEEAAALKIQGWARRLDLARRLLGFRAYLDFCERDACAARLQWAWRWWVLRRALERAAAEHRQRDNALAMLRHGFAVHKHGRRGRPLARRIRADADGKALEWASMVVFRRALALGDVRAILTGCASPGFARTEKYARGVTPDVALSLVTEHRTLDLECASPEDRDALASSLSVRLRLPVGASEDYDGFGGEQRRRHKHAVVAAAHRVVYDRRVERFILACILVNIVTMALASPVSSDTAMLDALERVEYCFAAVFTVEMLLRIVALEGLSGYVHDWWNVLDGVIVVSGWAGEIVAAHSSNSGVNFTALRAFRAMRALRTMRFLQGVREVLDTFVGTLVMVAQALVSYAYFVFLFAVLGVSFFGDALDNRCMAVVDGDVFVGAPERFCRPSDGALACPDGQTCLPRAAGQPFGNYMDLYGLEGDPDYDFLGFDNVYHAYRLIEKASQRAGLAYGLHGSLEYSSKTGSVVYFTAIMLLCSFMALALFVAIVRATFEELRRRRPARSRPAKHGKDTHREGGEDADDPPAAGKKSLLVRLQERAPAVPSRFALDKDGALSRAARRLIRHPRFESAVLLAILVNSVFLAMAYHGQPRWYERMLEMAELFFTVAFLGEMLAKIAGLGGVREYLVRDANAAWNRFDASIVVVSCVDLALEMNGSGAGLNLSPLRVFRLLRIVRVLRRNPQLYRVMQGIVNSVRSMFSLLIFMALVIIVFAILGMQLYGGHFGAETRATFDTFPKAMLTLFRMFSGGGAWRVYFFALRSTAGWSAPTFFTLYRIFSAYVTLNFLVVILLNSFAPSEAEVARQRAMREKQLLRLHNVAFDERELEELQSPSKQLSSADEDAADLDDGLDLSLDLDAAAAAAAGAGDIQLTPMRRTSSRRSQTPTTPREETLADMREVDLEAALGAIDDAAGGGSSDDDDDDDRAQGQPWHVRRRLWSLWLLPPESALREDLLWVVTHPRFEAGIILCIVVSSTLLTLETPDLENTDPQLFDTLNVLDVIFLVIFSLEFVAKALAYGFALSPSGDAYLSDGWNRLDIGVLFVTYLGFVGSGSGVGRTLRVGRILRPLRMINRNEAMKVTINAILQSLTQILYTLVVILAFFCICGTLGLNLFSGKFFRCNDPSVPDRAACVGLFLQPSTGIATPRVWANPPYSFDNIFSSLRTLFEVVTRTGWTPVLYSAMDVVDVDQQPRENHSSLNALFFVVFIFVGSFYLFKVFVGIIVAHFRKFSGTALLTPQQLLWVETKRMLRQLTPEIRPPEGRFRGPAFWLARQPWCVRACTVATILHLALLGSLTADMTDSHKDWIFAVHCCFTAVYAAEIALHMLARGGVFRYLCANKPWNFLDVALVVVLAAAVPAWELYGLGALRAFIRFDRVIDLLSEFPGLRRLLDTLRNSSIAMCNITALFFLVVFVYAVLGMHLFARVRQGVYINPNTNFEHFGRSMLTLFEVASGENWVQMVRDIEVAEPFCTRAADWSDCGEPWLGPLFFYSFYVFVFCVFLNLYVACILDTYTSTSRNDGAASWRITADQFNEFRAAWMALDPDAQGHIPLTRMRQLVVALRAPLGMDPDADRANFIALRQECKLCARENRRTGEDEISFANVLRVLSERLVPVDGLEIEERAVLKSKTESVRQQLAAVQLQRVVRGYLFRKGLHDIAAGDLRSASFLGYVAADLRAMDDDTYESFLADALRRFRASHHGFLPPPEQGEEEEQGAGAGQEQQQQRQPPPPVVVAPDGAPKLQRRAARPHEEERPRSQSMRVSMRVPISATPVRARRGDEGILSRDTVEFTPPSSTASTPPRSPSVATPRAHDQTLAGTLVTLLQRTDEI